MFDSCTSLPLSALKFDWGALTYIGTNAFKNCLSLENEKTLEYPNGKPIKVYCEVKEDAFTNCPLQVDIGY